jgi:ATP adenylyltransferase
MKYVENYEAQKDCFLCQALARPDNEENLIIERGTSAFVIMNLYPYTSGHIMVAPFEHQSSLEELGEDSRAEIMELVSRSIVVLKKIYKPHGFNVGINIGEAAGAGEPDHVHMHIVPRWTGDTNFLSTLGETRVLPEALGKTYKRIKAGFRD